MGCSCALQDGKTAQMDAEEQGKQSCVAVLKQV
jgi:hypothetical protein